MQGTEILSVKRVNSVMMTLRDTRELPQDLIWTNRTPFVDAEDADIMARFTGNVIAADIIGDGQKAVVRSVGKFTLETLDIPNFKHGENFSQSKLQLLNRIAEGFASGQDMGLFTDFKNRSIDSLLLGIRQRQEAVIVACAIDAFDYSRLGIQISNASWGMPSDLKVTMSPLITDTSGSRFVNTVLALNATAREKYGEVYDRLTMSTADFRLWIATDDFKNNSQLHYQQTFPSNTFPSSNIETMKILAEKILMMEIEFYDARYWEQANDGSISSSPFLPLGKVILSRKADDNSEERIAFKNGIVTESIVSQLSDGGAGMIGKFEGPEFGPVAYTTAEHNPPAMTNWAVARGWPGKKRLSSTAVITVR
jgi:hypothetical protein